MHSRHLLNMSVFHLPPLFPIWTDFKFLPIFHFFSPRLYPEIFANVTIFLVIGMMANCAAVQIMELAVVENVFVIVHMMFQDILHVNVRYVISKNRYIPNFRF